MNWKVWGESAPYEAGNLIYFCCFRFCPLPAKVCSQRGEDWIDPDTASNLEEAITEARTKGTEFEVLTYNNKVASK